MRPTDPPPAVFHSDAGGAVKGGRQEACFTGSAAAALHDAGLRVPLAGSQTYGSLRLRRPQAARPVAAPDDLGKVAPKRAYDDAHGTGGRSTATKADFTDTEWQTLQWAVTDTMAYLSMSDPGFWEMFKEAGGAAKYIAGVKGSGDSALVRELAGDMRPGRDKAVTGNPAEMSTAVIGRVSEAAKIVSEKAPEDLAAFRMFIIGVAKATAEAAEGTGPTEAAAIAKLEAALG